MTDNNLLSTANVEQQLTDMGFSRKEAKAYIFLLKLGTQPASVIAKKMELPRSTGQFILESLVKKHLATKMSKNKIFYYTSESPQNISTIIDFEKNKCIQLFADRKKKLDEVLPGLSALVTSNVIRPNITYYEGLEGIKKVYKTILKEGKDIYRFGDITKIYEALGVYTDEYIKERNELGFKTHAIMPFHEGQPSSKKINQKQNREVLYIPQKYFPMGGEIRIFGNKVGIISLQKDSPLGVIIESETIAKMFYSIFMVIWNNYAKEAFRE